MALTGKIRRLFGRFLVGKTQLAEQRLAQNATRVLHSTRSSSDIAGRTGGVSGYPRTWCRSVS